MIATDTAESLVSQEFKDHRYRVLHSGIVAPENTSEILGVARAAIAARIPSTSNSELLSALRSNTTGWHSAAARRFLWAVPANNEIRSPGRAVHTVDLNLLNPKIFYLLSMDDSRWPTIDVVRKAPTPTDLIPTTEAILATSALDLPSVVREFAEGVGDIKPTSTVVKEAARVVQAAIKYTKLSHITIDDEDGDLDFDFRNGHNLIVMANFFPDGTIDASVYDDSQGRPVRVRRMQRSSGASADELISLFEQGVSCAGTE